MVYVIQLMEIDMNNEQILKQAIIKAQDNGWKPFKDDRKYFEKYDMKDSETGKVYKDLTPNPSWGGQWHNVNFWENWAWLDIFTEDFAKAFWERKNKLYGWLEKCQINIT